MLSGQGGGPAAYGNRILALFSESDIDLLSPHLQDVVLPEQSVLSERNDREEHVYFPYRGTASLLAPMADGTAVELAITGRDGVIGCLSALGLPQAFAKTVVNVEMGAHRIATRRLSEILPRAETLRMALSAEAGRLMFQVQQLSGCNALHPIEQRLARLLLHSADCLGDNNIPFTQELMSQMLGVQRTTINLVVRSMVTTGIVRSRRGRVEIIERRVLESKACECYASIRSQLGRATSPLGHAAQSAPQESDAVGGALFRADGDEATFPAKEQQPFRTITPRF